MLKMKYLFENFALAKQALQNYRHDTERLDETLSWFRISANAVYPFFRDGALCFLRLAPAEEKNFQDIQGEIEFIHYLRSCGYPAMEPIPGEDGAYCNVLDTRWGKYYASAFRRVPGKPLEDVKMDGAVLREYGAALGTLHNLSQQFVPAVIKQSYSDALAWLQAAFDKEVVPEFMRRELEAVSGQLNALPRTAENFGLVHYDFEPDNVFWDAANQRCSVIDFDDGMYHWYALDVEQVFDSLGEFFQADALKQAKEQFLEGYRAHRAFTEEMEQTLPLMRRFINLYSYARLLHCLSESVEEKPKWMEQLEKRLRGKLNSIESTVASGRAEEGGVV